MIRLKALRVILHVEAEEPVYEYTGRLVKTLLYTLNKEIRLLHGLRGSISPLLISPLFTTGRKEFELGDVVTSAYLRDNTGEYILVPTKLDGEYLIHVGGEPGLVEAIGKSLERIRTPLAIKFNDNIVTFKAEKIEDVTEKILDKELTGGRVTIYIKSPAMIFNVFAPSRLPKFTPTAVELLMAPYMLLHGRYTLDGTVLLRASRLLGLLVETYYSLSTLKPVLIPFKGKKEAALAGKVTYIVDTVDEKKVAELTSVLSVAEIAGIGESRLNGFGVVTWTTK